MIAARWFQKLVAASDSLAKIAGGFVAFLALTTFLFPFVERGLSAVMAWRFGAVGYAYYEIDINGEPTGDGQLRLLEDGRYLFDEIRWGDTLQSVTDVNLRDGPTAKARSRFVLSAPECVVVLSRGAAFDVQDAHSGGWLFVGTAACGLFN